VSQYRPGLADVRLPDLHRVFVRFPRPTVGDVAAAVHAEMARREIAKSLGDASAVAIAVGSRGIAGIDRIVRSLVEALADSGRRVLVVPAMGSHGGATAEGQREVLAHLGITEATVGAPIRSSMETVEIATVASPHGGRVPVYTDAIAWRDADVVIPVNRVKPHTGFRGPVESGLCKMLAIGLGKHDGAARLHREGYGAFDTLVLEVGKAVLATGRVPFGLAVVENAYEETAVVEAVPGADIVAREQALLEEARRLMPGLPVPRVDVLVVERFGKNISGVGMDPNVTGRGELGVALPGFRGPDIERIVVLSLTPETEGNAHGIGLADIITQEVFDAIDRRTTWTNTLTAGSLACGRIPIALPTEDLAVAAAADTVPGMQPEDARVVRIKDTLSLSEIAVSENLLDTAAVHPDCDPAGPWDRTWRLG
jgi:hypothetical protein